MERSQLGILFFPAAVKDFHRNTQVGLSLFQDPLLLLWGEGADLAFVRASFGAQGRKAAMLIVIPPVFEGAQSKNTLTAIGQAQRTTAHLFQGQRNRKTLA